MMWCSQDGAARPAPITEAESSQLISGVSWSQTKPDKFASCSAASSDVHIWNASRGRKDMTLSANGRAVSHAQVGRVGLMALQTLQVRARLRLRWSPERVLPACVPYSLHVQPS